jgi:hypothetical protein
MNEADNRKARAGSVANLGAGNNQCSSARPCWRSAGSAQLRARGKLHAARWHMEDGCSASYIEGVRPLCCRRTQAGAGRNFVRDAVHAAAPASKQENLSRVMERNSLV